MRIKNNILKGVYEDNLRIIGKKKDNALRRHYFPVKKVVLPLLVVFLMLFLHDNIVTSPFLPARQVTANVIPLPPPLPGIETSNPSDYRTLIDKRDISLSRVFGLGVKTIMIDPGHGGTDPGTIGKSGIMEKDITLDIAKRLRDRLIKDGRFNVLMTREQDATLPLNKRVELARSHKADLFVSIHVNYLPSKPINIIETYYFGPSSDTKTLSLAERENAGSHYGISEFRAVIEKIGETIKLQESKKLAASIQSTLFSNLRNENGNAFDFGVKRAPFVVLLGADVPAVLAEVSCISNREEELKLSGAAHRENIAHYLQGGILDYINKGESGYESTRRAEKR